MAIHIISDGGADLPEQLRADWNIKIVPLGVQIGNDTFTSEMEKRDFYKKMKESAELPKTSSPSPHAFMEAYRSVPPGESMIVLSLSSGLSSTFDHAVLARELFLAENPNAGPIEVLDSRTASSGLGMLAYRAAKLVKEGLPHSDIVQFLKHTIEETKTYFTLDTLENVIKGGRLDRVRGAVASILNIKLVMRASPEGTIQVFEKVRGTQNAVKRIVDMIDEVKDSVEKRVLAIAHSNCEDRAKELLQTILGKYAFQEAVISEMGPVIGTYAGEGGLVISY
ncbi:DegV family protein [Paenibacillus thermotolerans]|uniref:DegV family protein n=1 Tax=Paenibacillus thermotolerans TaxID=3027807 RepID=UPI002368309F|nr:MULTISPECIES: DegV family protein [unclassified Paenibacillus]